MELSIIIVNYNVRHFLEQCLHSVRKACEGLQAELIVFDNNSTDGSLDYLRPLFPEILFIASEDNIGFSRANNKAIKHATGEWVLLLNPDTLLPEDCLHRCLAFAQQHPDLGALGIRMVDGSGRFLPESKRGFPTPLTSLYKLTGLSALFPHSRIFARYHLGYLDQHQNHKVEVLAGAFMLIRRSILQLTGGFDESFFMYGEDIDLSYRIRQAGFQNYYFQGSSIIHFKGESTRKGSLNYVRMFYQAMNLFVSKHYSGTRAFWFRLFIQIAIGLRALASGLSRFVKHAGLPVLDIFITVGCLLVTKSMWYQYVRPDIEPAYWVNRYAIPCITLVFTGTASLAGLYDKWYKPWRVFKSMLLAILVVLAGYSLLPEALRFSRGIIVVAGLAAALLILLLRKLLAIAGWNIPEDEDREYRQTMIACTEAQSPAMEQLLDDFGIAPRLLGRFAVAPGDTSAMAAFSDLPAFFRQTPFRETICCISNDLPLSRVLVTMEKMKQKGPHFSFHAFGSNSIVGSSNKDKAGKVQAVINSYHLAKPWHRRSKRLFDIATGIVLLVCSPVLIWFVSRPKHLLQGIFRILAGKATWVGYLHPDNSLPPLSPGIIGCNGIALNHQRERNAALNHAMDERYARQYQWTTDALLVLRNLRQLGN